MNWRAILRAGVVGAMLALTIAGAAQPAQAQAAKVLVGHESQVQNNSHGLGVAGDFKGGLSGFAYRHYFGNNALQIDLLPLYADRGNYLAMYFGAQYINYALVWSGARRGALLPTTTALRLTLAGSVHAERDQQTAISVDTTNCQTQQCKDITNAKSAVSVMYSMAGGFGFEFGAVQRSGFSVAADLMMTVLWDRVGFYGAYPLPYASLMYSW
ncbi:MAG: hypothetical protein HY902_10935 [Deltaproteobacteria bacterium]|nr:hypothetical protein [Deltaproteobacteria bacterium]